MTCSIWPRSARMRPLAAADVRHELDVLADQALAASCSARPPPRPGPGRAACSTCLRLKVRSWRVRSAARSAAVRICSRLRVHRRPASAGAREGQRRVAEHHGEQVVEVVGDAAGEPAHRLHLLRLPQLLLEQVALGDVARVDDDGADGGVVAMAHRHRLQRSARSRPHGASGRWRSRPRRDGRGPSRGAAASPRRRRGASARTRCGRPAPPARGRGSAAPARSRTGTGRRRSRGR